MKGGTDIKVDILARGFIRGFFNGDQMSRFYGWITNFIFKAGLKKK